MKSKWMLFTGIVLLVLGIFLRKTAGLEMEGLLLILTGVSLKTIYIVGKARSGEYKPGYDLIFLFVGLAMFMSGLYIRSHNLPFNSLLLIIPGLILKIIFILLFIRNVRSNKKN